MPPRTDWAARLAEIKAKIMARIDTEEAIDRGTQLMWIRDLTESDVRFLKTLRIQA